MKVQRLRLRFSITGDAVLLSHRDLVGALEEAAKASALPLVYSEGKRPAPQITMAAPLPQGVSSSCELADLFLSEHVDPTDAFHRVSRHLPTGMELQAAGDVGISGPSLQTQLRWAEYELELPDEPQGFAELQVAIDRLLRAATLPSEYRREHKVRAYDLRPLVLGLWLENAGEGCSILRMRLRAEPERTGRADQVALTLGLTEFQRVHRRTLYFDEVSPAALAYRRNGEAAEG